LPRAHASRTDTQSSIVFVQPEVERAMSASEYSALRAGFQGMRVYRSDVVSLGECRVQQLVLVVLRGSDRDIWIRCWRHQSHNQSFTRAESLSGCSSRIRKGNRQRIWSNPAFVACCERTAIASRDPGVCSDQASKVFSIRQIQRDPSCRERRRHRLRERGLGPKHSWNLFGSWQDSREAVRRGGHSGWMWQVTCGRAPVFPRGR
jgi:hypothetical protein